MLVDIVDKCYGEVLKKNAIMGLNVGLHATDAIGKHINVNYTR